MCLGIPLNLVSLTFAIAQKPSIPLIRTWPLSERVAGIINADMPVAEINEAVIAATSVSVDDDASVDLANIIHL